MAGNGTEAGPRLTRRGRETRDRIVAAAAELIFERGVAETTLEDIRAAAGVSGSQVYHYFADKQALVRAVIDHQAEAILDAQGTHLDHLDTMPGLRAWRDLLVGHQRTLECRGGCPLGTLGAELAEIDDVARMAVARGFGRWEARIRDGLGAMHARGDLPASADPDDLALAILAALQGGLLLAQVQRQTRPLEVALDAMLDRIQALTETASRNAGAVLQQLGILPDMQHGRAVCGEQPGHGPVGLAAAVNADAGRSAQFRVGRPVRVAQRGVPDREPGGELGGVLAEAADVARHRSSASSLPACRCVRALRRSAGGCPGSGLFVAVAGFISGHQRAGRRLRLLRPGRRW